MAINTTADITPIVEELQKLQKQDEGRYEVTIGYFQDILGTIQDTNTELEEIKAVLIDIRKVLEIMKS